MSAHIRWLFGVWLGEFVDLVRFSRVVQAVAAKRGYLQGGRVGEVAPIFAVLFSVQSICRTMLVWMATRGCRNLGIGLGLEIVFAPRVFGGDAAVCAGGGVRWVSIPKHFLAQPVQTVHFASAAHNIAFDDYVSV